MQVVPAVVERVSLYKIRIKKKAALEIFRAAFFCYLSWNGLLLMIPLSVITAILLLKSVGSEV